MYVHFFGASTFIGHVRLFGTQEYIVTPWKMDKKSWEKTFFRILQIPIEEIPEDFVPLKNYFKLLLDRTSEQCFLVILLGKKVLGKTFKD